VVERQIAYLWVPEFGARVARRAKPQLPDRPLALLDEHGRVLAADASAARAGVVPGLTERQAAAHCPGALLLPAARFPVWEHQEQFLARIKGYTDRWQPDGLGRVYLDATAAVPFGRPAAVERELLRWCQAVAAEVRALGWLPSLGATCSKFGAGVAGQVAWQNAALLLAPAAQRAFLTGQPAAALPLDADALTQLHHLGIRTLGQYARLPATGVLARFGPAGRTAQRWAQGLDDRPVLPPWESAEVAARIEFEAPLADRDRLLAVLMQRADRLLTPLRDRLQAVARLLLTITRADGRTIPVTHTFPLPTAAGEPVHLALTGLLGRVTWDDQGAAEVVLTLAGITDAPSRQLTLFDPQEDDRARLSALLERLAARFGADAFRLASLSDPDHLLLERRAAFRPWP
jgi:nucleotidyltransferase/DNA polymerase involved in DNA repair